MRVLSFALFVLTISVANADEPTGPELFATHCAACHGGDAEGGGPAATVMTITVPNLRTLSMRNGGAFPADAVAAYIDGREHRAAHGSREMPIWGDFLQVENAAGEPRIAALVAFIQGIQYR